MKIECSKTNAPTQTDEGVCGADASVRQQLVVEPTGAAPIAEMASQVALMIERSLGSRRASAAARREASDLAQDAAEKAQVGAMREEARDTFKQALVSCAISFGASAVQTVGAGLQLRGAELQAKASSFGGTTQAAWMVSEAGRAAAWGKCLEAGAKTFEAVSGGANGIIGAEAKQDAVDAKEHENTAHHASRASQREAESERELGELASKTLARLEEVLQGQRQTQLALIQRA